MTKEKPTLVDAIWKKINNNKLIAFLIVAGGIIIGIASFSDSIVNIFTNVSKIVPTKQVTKVVDPLPPKPDPSMDDKPIHHTDPIMSSSESYFTPTFQLSKRTEGIIVNLSKDNVIIDFSLTDEGKILKYVLTKEKDQFIINPYHEYLLLLQGGGVITPPDDWSLFDFQFPTLDFKVVNNSDKTVFFTKAIVSVATSKPDSFPVLIVRRGDAMCFPIENIGWGKVYNCSVKFNLVEPDTQSDFNSDYTFTMNMGSFANSEALSLSKCFATFGVDTNVIRQRFSSSRREGNKRIYTIEEGSGLEKKFSEEEYESRLNKARGPFKKGVAKMYGEILYEGRNMSGKLVKEKVRFENSIRLGEPLAGVSLPPSFVYDLMFESNKTNYTKEISLSQVVKPNEADRFGIKLAAPISSRHQFNITLFYNENNQFTIKNMSLNYFMSQLHSWRIKDKNKSEKKQKRDTLPQME